MSLPAYIRAAATPHAEARDWAVRVIAAGGGVSSSTLKAVSRFCCAIDTAGIRSAMYRVNMFCGGNLSGCLVPLYRGPTFGGTNFGNATDTNKDFVPKDFIETGTGGGLKADGITKYLNTGMAPTVLPNLTDMHFSTSSPNLATSGNFVLMGTRDGNNSGHMTLDEYSPTYPGRFFRCGSFAAGEFPLVLSPGSSEPHFIGTRTSATSSIIYRNGILAASNATSITPTSHSFPFFIFATNTAGSPAGPSAATLRMYSIGNGLTATQAAAFSAAVIQFNTALGRA